MNKRQHSKLSMYVVMVLFFAKNSTIYTSFAKLVDEISDFLISKGLLDCEITKQGHIDTGVTADKNVLVLAAIELVVKFSRKARVWAGKNEIQTLEHLFDIRKTDYTDIHESEALDALISVRNALNTNIIALATYNVLPADIIKIDKAIEDAKKSIGTPKMAKISRVVSTAAIVDLIKKVDEHLSNIDDLLIPEYDGTSSANTEMVANYKISRELVAPGESHSGVHSVCKDSLSGDLLENVKMEIVELKKTTLSTILGIAEIIKCKPGTYHVKFSLAGYTDFMLVITIHKGVVIEMESLMVKIVVSG